MTFNNLRILTISEYLCIYTPIIIVAFFVVFGYKILENNYSSYYLLVFYFYGIVDAVSNKILLYTNYELSLEIQRNNFRLSNFVGRLLPKNVKKYKIYD